MVYFASQTNLPIENDEVRTCYCGYDDGGTPEDESDDNYLSLLLAIVCFV